MGCHARQGLGTDAGHDEEAQQHWFFSFLFSHFSFTRNAIFTYWSLPQSLYTSINPRLSTFWDLGADCANLPNSLLSCLGLEDACCAWCSLALSTSSFYGRWGGRGEKKGNVTVESGETQKCSAQEEPGKDWASLVQAAGTVLWISIRETRERFE